MKDFGFWVFMIVLSFLIILGEKRVQQAFDTIFISECDGDVR